MIKDVKTSGFIEDGNVIYFGNRSYADKIYNLISHDSKSLDYKAIYAVLCGMKEFNAGIVEADNYLIAWADHIRSKPIFYTLRDGAFIVSCNARSLIDDQDQPDPMAVTEFSMAGYVTGERTIYPQVFSIEPGEVVIWDKKKHVLHRQKYFRYEPDFVKGATDKENIQRLGGILDALIKKIINRAEGKTIWVPLSAGLDSRILLCKLHEHGYQNIQTFTYGPKFNFEALHAKKIAEALGLPWRMITLSRNKTKSLFDSQTRKAFWEYADGLKSIPCMREFAAIYYLYDNNLAKPGDIFLNGQSGDYITGGHIPEKWCDKDHIVSRQAFIRHLLDKHYDLWFDLKTTQHEQHIEKQIISLIGQELPERAYGPEYAKYHEMWEYEGRQICYVVNGQRVYEFFNYQWEMPLWEKELVDFCETLPLEQKKNQYLYKEYLKSYNYKGLFPEKEPYIWRWPIPMLWVVFVAQLVGWVKGKEAKKGFYAKMRNKGHYANQYAFFPNGLHKKTYNKCRNVISLYIPIWKSENI